jgi:hypothetical protein
VDWDKNDGGIDSFVDSLVAGTDTGGDFPQHLSYIDGFLIGHYPSELHSLSCSGAGVLPAALTDSYEYTAVTNFEDGMKVVRPRSDYLAAPHIINANRSVQIDVFGWNGATGDIGDLVAGSFITTTPDDTYPGVYSILVRNTVLLCMSDANDDMSIYPVLINADGTDTGGTAVGGVGGIDFRNRNAFMLPHTIISSNAIDIIYDQLYNLIVSRVCVTGLSSSSLSKINGAALSTIGKMNGVTKLGIRKRSTVPQ